MKKELLQQSLLIELGRKAQSLNFIQNQAQKLKNHVLNSMNYISKLQKQEVRNINHLLDEVERNSSVNEKEFSKVLLSAEEILHSLHNTRSNIRMALERRIIALRYRTGNRGLESNKKLQKKLFKTAARWVDKQHVLSDNMLSFADWDKLRVIAQYKDFVSLIMKFPQLRDELFQWVIRDHLDPEIFIQFPGLKERIVKSNLHGRLGYYSGKHLNIREKNDRKIVTMFFKGREVNILDDDLEVEFRENLKMTVGEVFHVFEKKDTNAGNLEHMEEGIVNWNVHEWGRYNAEKQEMKKVDFELRKWWNQLPVFETLSLVEAQERYGNQLDGYIWTVASRATRTEATMNTLGTHAFLEIVIPTEDGNGYRVYPMGKYAIGVPMTFNAIEGMGYMCQMAPATIAYLDENVFYSHRQQTHYAFPITPDQGLDLMELIQENMIDSREKNFVYQIETENCAKWVQETLVSILGEDKVPNLFKISYLDVELDGVPGAVMNFVRLFPRNWQGWVLTRLHIPLGAGSGVWIEKGGKRFFISLKSLPFWEDAMIYAPPLLHHQQQNGTLGKVSQTRVSLEIYRLVEAVA